MLSQDDEEVGLYFIIPSKCKTKEECESVMLDVFKDCEKQGLDPQWLTETKCLALQPDKRNVFVFQRFEGEAFSHLRNFKCVLVGPQCLLTIFKENIQLPHLPKPFFTMAMSGLMVAASGFGPQGKETIKSKIELMAGQYMSQLRAGTSHLIVNSVQSEKYSKAIAASIPVMTEDWIDAVYTASVKGYVKATDPQFEAFKCPPFKGLLVSSSKLSASHRKKVADLIESNGGTHVGCLTNSVQLLVVSKPDGEKFKYARAWNIPCVSPSYVFDSVEYGQALSVEAYEIKGVHTSSPERSERPDPNFSTISNIALSERSHVDQTLCSTVSETTTTSYFKAPRKPRDVTSGESGVFVRPQAPPNVPSSPNRLPPPDGPSRRNLTPKKAPSPAQFKHLLDELNEQTTKQAGQFLDGCKVFLYGFNSEHEEKLRRILKGSGASRFTELSESVTHVLLGDDCDKAFLKHLKELVYRPHVVTLQWFLQSVTLRRPANEEPYSYAEVEAKNAAPETPSPLSKKGLALLQRGDESPVAERVPDARATDSAKLSGKMSSKFLKELREPEKNGVSDLTAFYRNESTSEPPAPIPPAHPSYRSRVGSSDESKDYSTVCSQGDQPIFSGLKFVVVGLEVEVIEEISKVVSRHSGQVVPRTFKGVPDYAVVPLTGAAVSAAGEIVTPLWVEDCIFHGTIIPAEYYHLPMSVQSGKYPLKGCVIGLSGYTRKERLFLMDMTRILGGLAQEVFARKDNPEKNAKASTHLVCNAAEGNKFSAAKKWKLPAVTHLWLLQCSKTGRRASVRPFLIEPEQDIVEDIPADNAETNGNSDSEIENVPKIPSVTSVEASSTLTAGTSGKSGVTTDEETQVKAALEEEPKTPLRPRALQRIAGEEAALSPFHVSTPDTPYGVSSNPSPGERKRIKKWLDRFPDYPLDPEPKRRLSTPLSEIKRQMWRKIAVPTPQTPEEKKSGNKRTNDGDEESLTESAKRARTDEVDERPQGVDTPPITGKESIPKNLFPDNVSRAEDQIEEANKLLEMALPIAGISSANSSTGKIKSSPVKEKIVAPRVPKEVSQPYDINWEDPVTVAEAKNEDRRSTISSASSSKRKSLEEEDIPRKKSSLDSKPENSDAQPDEAPKSRVFMLSNIDEREHYAKMVEKLGGVVLQGVHFEKSLTHLVIDRPVRSEKLLASIATGKWVLPVAYIEDSFKAGKFLDEADYEWGAPRNEKWNGLLRPGSNESQLANAAYRWRKKLSGTGLGAFQNMRAVVEAAPNRVESFRRLIEAGGGVVLPPSELEKATHHLMDHHSKSAQHGDNPYKVPVFPLIHLNEFLMKGPSSKDSA